MIRVVRYDGNVRMKLRLTLSGLRSAVCHTACGTVEVFEWNCRGVQDLTDGSESDGMAESNGNIRPYLACGTEFAMWQLRPSLPPHLYKCGGKDGLDNLKVKTKRRQWK